MTIECFPILRVITKFEPGIYLNYGGSKGTRLVVPIKGQSGAFQGQAIVIGKDEDAFQETTIDLSNSFLVVGAQLVIASPLSMKVGLGALSPGCLSPVEGRIAISALDPFGDNEWIELATGNALEPKANRYFYSEWHVSVHDSWGNEMKLFESVRNCS